MKAKAAGGLFKRFLGHVVPRVIRPLHILWNQLMGFLFLVIAAGAAPSLVRTFKQFSGDFEGVARVALACVFVGVMLYFGITSLMRARRIERS